MTYFKKIIFVLAVLILAAICGYRIYRVNTIYPSPENIACQPGDTVKYKGILMHTGEIEIYTSEDAAKAYPNVADLIKDQKKRNNGLL